ncbi:hypothetical protein CFC21_033901, partial [Triticum aestivum]
WGGRSRCTAAPGTSRARCRRSAGAPPRHAPPLPRPRRRRAPGRPLRPRRRRARRERAGGLPALQRRQGVGAHQRRHGGDGGLRHGRHRHALRRRLGPLHRRQPHLPRQARHGQDAAHLPRLRRGRGLRKRPGVETRDQSHFITEENIERLRNAKEANRCRSTTHQYNYTDPICAPNNDDNSRTGTVGCVAVDASGGLASATSTGGLVNKMAGRIGDTPVIGAGTYANALCAVSTTARRGHHEAHRGARRGGGDGAPGPLAGGGRRARRGRRAPGLRGARGRVGRRGGHHAYNTTGMFRACATEDGYSEVAIWPA